MNPCRYLTALAAITALMSGATTRAQQTPPSALPPAPLRHTEDITIDIGPQLHQELAQAQRQLEHQVAEIRHSTGDVARNAVAAARLHAALALPIPPRPSSPSLLIRTRDLDPEAQTQLEEDLKVMSRIVEKATQLESRRSPRAMGIDLVFGPDHSPVRSLYLDGYGVLFMVNVDFPLLPLPVQAPEKSEDAKSDVTSTWEQTRQELYGDPRPPEPILPIGWFGDPNTETLAYDADKVDRLRQNLIEAIRNASNMRQLTANESVTICVQGAPATPVLQVRRESTIDKPDGTGRNVEVQQRYATVLTAGEKTDAHRAILTLQASKADIDRYARGDLSPDQFRELTQSQIYPGAGWNAFSPSFWSTR
ncbi:MAG: hypothetical protein KJ072_20440 [Verrucomicrobia bacterium]|nr:hypothetical protein [Verrucomicrobiota bacterium]